MWSLPTKLTEKQRMIGKGVAALLIGAILFPMPSKAIFGVGDITFDPSVFATVGHIWDEDVSTGQKIIEEVNQLTKIYTTAFGLYQNAQEMKQRFSSGTRSGWMTAVQTGIDNYTRNQYGETVLWPQVMNGAPAMAPQAWTNATVAMQQQAIGSPTIGSPEAAALALVEMIDGASVQCMQNLAQYHQNAIANQQAISFFHMKASDDTDSTGSQIEQAILSNFGLIHANNELRAQGTIQSCEATQQMLANKQVRDEIAANMNSQAALNRTLASPAMSVKASTNPWSEQIP